MYRDIAKLIMYGDIDEDCILYQMGEIFREFEEGTQSNAVLIRKVYTQIKRLLTVATDFGFDKNLWHNYLAYFLITNENPFSITCEKSVQTMEVSTILREMILQPSKICLSMIFLKLRNPLVLTALHRFPIIMPLRKRIDVQ